MTLAGRLHDQASDLMSRFYRYGQWPVRCRTPESFLEDRPSRTCRARAASWLVSGLAAIMAR